MAVARDLRAADAVATDEAAQRLAAAVRATGAQVAVPEDALEPALKVLLEACGAAAGALCLYDQRQDLLRLAAESGLSDEGCRQLRTMRRGG